MNENKSQDSLFRKELVSIRRKIHQFPELGNTEFRTTELLEKKLRSAGIKTSRITKTGVIGLVTGTKKTDKKLKIIAVRGDIDALPVLEKTGKEYASKIPGIMHACGHDANCTMVLGAALILQKRKKEFSGSVKLIFQPNEESSGGASDMIKAGILKKPDVDAIIGIHVSPWLDKGVLGLKENEMMAAVDKFEIEIIGEGGHGAYPHMGKDAIVAASSLILNLQSIVAREIDPVEPVVITVGRIQGGERYNILCGKVKIEGTVRTLNEKVRKLVKHKMENMLRCIAELFEVNYKINYVKLGYPLVNDRNILDLCLISGKKYLGLNKVEMLTKPSMGGEDFAEYLSQVPGCFMYFGTGTKNTFPWHHEKFDIDEDILPSGAGVLAAIAQSFLSDLK